jgi:hypothetical protein
VEARALFGGDWHPIVRDPLDVLRLVFVGGAIVYSAVSGDSLINLAVSSAAVLAVRFVALPRPYELGFILAMALTGWGDALGLYDRFANYDSLVHFLVPFEVAPVVYILLARADLVPDLSATKGGATTRASSSSRSRSARRSVRSGKSSSGPRTTPSAPACSTAKPTRSRISWRIPQGHCWAARCSSSGASTGGARANAVLGPRALGSDCP